MQNKRDGQPQSVYLKSAHREIARQLGNGNVSDGIRIALEKADRIDGEFLRNVLSALWAGRESVSVDEVINEIEGLLSDPNEQ